MRYEYYSNVALVSSVIVYALGMFAHAAEWAAARRVSVAGKTEPELVDVAAEDRHAKPSTMRPEPVEGASKRTREPRPRPAPELSSLVAWALP